MSHGPVPAACDGAAASSMRPPTSATVAPAANSIIFGWRRGDRTTIDELLSAHRCPAVSWWSRPLIVRNFGQCSKLRLSCYSSDTASYGQRLRRPSWLVFPGSPAWVPCPAASERSGWSPCACWARRSAARLRTGIGVGWTVGLPCPQPCTVVFSRTLPELVTSCHFFGQNVHPFV